MAESRIIFARFTNELDCCRKHGISDVAVYNWRSRYGGTDVSGAP
ncbi:transposase IS3/IS911 [Pandoraea sp. SD6-2]|nr:transposase IS3/IS911 [Pandoraea sp. SD6-2]